MFATTRMILAIAIGTTFSVAQAQTLPQVAEYNLPSDLERSSNNYHPQGLGVNEDTGELLYAQQSARTVSIGTLDGQILRTVGSIRNYTTSVAYHDGRLYYSDYQGNSGGEDMWSINVASGGSEVRYGTDVAAYGGFPMDIRDGILYRTELSTTYGWSNLNELWVSPVGSPNSFLRQLTLDVPSGIGDIAVDLERNSVWVLDYTANARVREFDLDTGAAMAQYQVVGDGLDAGITVYQTACTTTTGSTPRPH
ncbi:MAG: hypothetical protein ACJATT_002976 [Myxococcota bacterium]|jgi:hypothetical protein